MYHQLHLVTRPYPRYSSRKSTSSFRFSSIGKWNGWVQLVRIGCLVLISLRCSYSSETGWDLVASDGTIVASALPGTYSMLSEELVNETFTVAKDEAYTFFLIDTASDGSKSDRINNAITTRTLVSNISTYLRKQFLMAALQLFTWRMFHPRSYFFF